MNKKPSNNNNNNNNKKPDKKRSWRDWSFVVEQEKANSMFQSGKHEKKQDKKDKHDVVFKKPLFSPWQYESEWESGSARDGDVSWLGSHKHKQLPLYFTTGSKLLKHTRVTRGHERTTQHTFTREHQTLGIDYVVQCVMRRKLLRYFQAVFWLTDIRYQTILS